MSGKVTPKLGRPRKAQADKRSEIVAVKVTPRERASLEQKSRGRKSVSDYIREKALS